MVARKEPEWADVQTVCMGVLINCAEISSACRTILSAIKWKDSDQLLVDCLLDRFDANAKRQDNLSDVCCFAFACLRG